MISIDGKINVAFSNMGLFDTEADWIHPTVTINTYELIFVTEGEVKIREKEKNFRFKKGDMLLLEPGLEHGGTEESRGHTAFYWLHFFSDDISALKLPKLCHPSDLNAERIFKEIMHLSKTSTELCELTLLKFLLSLNENKECRNKLAYDLDEYIRINARKQLSVARISKRFGYSADYLSRTYKREFGTDIKTGIIKQRLGYIESQLINTNFTTKEIAAMCGFEDENSFVKFFKYHEKTTPTLFRNKFFYVHMNNK